MVQPGPRSSRHVTSAISGSTLGWMSCAAAIRVGGHASIRPAETHRWAIPPPICFIFAREVRPIFKPDSRDHAGGAGAVPIANRIGTS